MVQAYILLLGKDEAPPRRRSMKIIASGDLDELTRAVHPEAVNREAKDEPLACRGRGPAAFAATAHWLRAAFADLDFDIHDVATDGDLVVVHCTKSGRQIGTLLAYDERGEVAQALPSKGRTLAITQTHLVPDQGQSGRRALGQPR
jgi:hypothetical protein